MRDRSDLSEGLAAAVERRIATRRRERWAGLAYVAACALGLLYFVAILIHALFNRTGEATDHE